MSCMAFALERKVWAVLPLKAWLVLDVHISPSTLWFFPLSKGAVSSVGQPDHLVSNPFELHKIMTTSAEIEKWNFTHNLAIPTHYNIIIFLYFFLVLTQMHHHFDTGTVTAWISGSIFVFFHLTLYWEHFPYCSIIFIIIILKLKNILLSRFATIYFLNHFPVIRRLV